MSSLVWPFGGRPPEGVGQLGPHVLAYYPAGPPFSNSAIVLGREAALVFDANIFHYASDLKRLLDERRPRGPAHLVLSHSHSDHVDGSMYFSGTESWATDWTRRRLGWWSGQDQSERWLEQAEGHPEAQQWYLEEFRLVVPEHGIEEPTSIQLGGGVEVRLQPEVIAHTPGDLWAWVEPDGVVLCGDLWFHDFEPWLGLGALEGSLEALGRMRAAGGVCYLPGHGLAGRLENDDKMIDYIEWIQEHVRLALGSGLTGPALATRVRREFERKPPVRFALQIDGFLEDAVAGAEEAACGQPRWADLPLANR